MTVRKKPKRRVAKVDFTRVRVGRRKPRRLWPPAQRDYDLEWERELDDLTAAEHNYGWGRD